MSVDVSGSLALFNSGYSSRWRSNLRFKRYRINMRSIGVANITVLGQLMSQGALLDSTPGAAQAGGATLDLRGLDVEDWSPIEPYLDQISNLDGYPGS